VSDGALDQVNRFALALLALAVIFLALLVVLLAWGAPSGTIDKIADLANWLRRHNDTETKTIVTLGALVVTLVMVMVMIVELTPSPTQKMRVRKMTAGHAVITTREIASRIDADVTQAPSVTECRSTVAARGKRVDVVLDLHVEPGADLSRTADDACHRAHLLVERELGIELASRPRARLHYRELRLRGDAAPAPPPTGWERPPTSQGERHSEEERDDRPGPDTPEEAQA
jgi:hypothetical protein